MRTAQPGSPTRPGPCPELRGSPAAPPGDSDGSAASAIAGRASTQSQADVTANRPWARPRPRRLRPLSEERINREPCKPDDDGHAAPAEQRADQPGPVLTPV